MKRLSARFATSVSMPIPVAERTPDLTQAKHPRMSASPEPTAAGTSDADQVRCAASVAVFTKGSRLETTILNQVLI